MPNPEKPIINLWIALSLAQQSMTNQIEERLKHAALPPLVWFEVLFELEHAPECLRPFELQKVLLFKQHNLSRLLARMIDAKVIQEGDAPADGRGKTVCATEEGRKMSRRMWHCYSPVLHSMHAQISEHVDPEQVTNALRSLVSQKILDHFEVE